MRLIAYSVKRWNNSVWLIILLLFPTILYRFLGNVDQTNSEFVNNTLGKVAMYIFDAEETNSGFYPILWIRFLMAGLLIWKNGMWDRRESESGIVEYENNGIYYCGLPMQYRHVVTCTWTVSYTHLDVYKRQLYFLRL